MFIDFLYFFEIHYNHDIAYISGEKTVSRAGNAGEMLVFFYC